MASAVVEVMAVIAVALSKATMIAPMTVALVMAAVAIQGLTIDVAVAPWSGATEIAAGVRARTAIGTATTVVGERAGAARAAA
jgi:hypothetical protein